MTNLSPRPIAGLGLVVGLLLALALCPAAARADHLASRLAEVAPLQEGATNLDAPVDRMTYQPEPANPQARQDAGDHSVATPNALSTILLVPAGTQPVTASTDPPPSGPSSNPTPPPPAQPPGPPPSSPPGSPPGNPPPNTGGGGGTVSSASTPEPTSLVLGMMGMGMAGVASWARRRKNGAGEKKD